MILADKIISLRKKNGWSQEELAEKINVSRQSVSKWEGAQSVPDLDKILQLSKIFGVSTDFMLKDELEEAEYVDDVDGVGVTRRVTMAEANEFLSIKEFTAKRIAVATYACILSPICLILLGGLSEEIKGFPLSEDVACGIGMVVLFLLVAAAVAVFVSCGIKTKPYEYMEKEVFETEYGVSGMVKERRKQFSPTYTRSIVMATCICILAAVPLFAGSLFSESEVLAIVSLCVTIALAGIGVMVFILAGIKNESYLKLLQEDDYSREKKTSPSISSVIGSVFWLVTVAIYLFYSFKTNDWNSSWIIWPVAGVLFAAISVICNAVEKRNK